MATEEQIFELRGLISEPDDSNGWTDERLSSLIDGTATMNAAAARGWLLKAGEYASLVDVSESGSSRKLSDLRKNAMEMSQYYGSLDGAATPTHSGPVIGRIRRTFG